MGYAIFNKGEYRYFDQAHRLLFNADKTHELLFDYVTKDLSKLPMLMEKHISGRMDLETCELKNCFCDDAFNEIISILKSSHPYYEHEDEKVFVKEIGNYLNALLGGLNLEEKLPPKKSGNEFERWYFGIFRALIKPLAVSIDQIEKFYSAYKSISGSFADNNEYEILLFYPPKAAAFYNELETQKAIGRVLFLIFDISAPNIGKLTISQRAWIYENIFSDPYSLSTMTATKHLTFSANIPDDTKFEPFDELRTIFISPNTGSNDNIYNEDISSETLIALKRVAEYAKAVSQTGVCEKYDIGNLYQLLYLEAMHMMQTNTLIRRCRYCNRYFTVPNRKIVYCNRIVEGEKAPCSVVGRKQSFKRKMKTEPALEMYTRAYKTHHARIRNKIMSTAEFSIWSSEAKKRLDDVREGKLDISEFEKWLKK